MAGAVFAGIGVQLDWRAGEPAHSSSDASIAIELVTGTPDTFMPGALAYARPYEGVHIQVFYDRIHGSPARTELLAHVLVHEITHIVQGIARHSESGVMQAHWTPQEVDRMRDRALPFAEEDVVRIRQAMMQRAMLHRKPTWSEIALNDLSPASGRIQGSVLSQTMQSDRSFTPFRSHR